MPESAINARWDTYIRDAIQELGSQSPGDWVGLVELRHVLDGRGTRRPVQDEQLRRMSREGKITLTPEANRKVLTDTDHAAAVTIGGEPCHLVQWN